MTETPEELREQTQQYRDFHASRAGAVLTEAIEQVAVALDLSADIIEAKLSRRS